MNHRLLLLLCIAALLAGCASGYPPTPSPEPPVSEPEGTPSPEAPQPAPDVPPRTPRANTETPTLALLQQSERSADSGDLDGAIAYVERAIRLNSRDPTLWLRLARLQLQADRPARAEQLAQKAIALSGDENQTREGWLLVADALDAQGDDEEAARIRARWRTFRG